MHTNWIIKPFAKKKIFWDGLKSAKIISAKMGGLEPPKFELKYGNYKNLKMLYLNMVFFKRAS